MVFRIRGPGGIRVSGTHHGLAWLGLLGLGCPHLCGGMCEPDMVATGDWTALSAEDLTSVLHAQPVSPPRGPRWLERHTWPWGVGTEKADG